LRRTPTPEEELILLFCGTAERRRRAHTRIETLAREVDYDGLAALMARQLLLPLLGRRLVETAPEAVPPTFLAHLEQAAAAARRRGVVLEMLGAQVQSDLRQAGVEVLPLKGATLSRSLYGDPGIRVAKDIDLLVEADQLDRAAAILARRGYRRVDAPGGERPQLHLSLEHERSELPPVEIHWRVHWYEEAFSQRMLQRSGRTPEGLRAQPPDELASLLLFFSRDGLTGLRLAADVAAWWDLHAAAEGAASLDQVARETPELRPALSAAAITLDRLVGTPADAIISRGERSSSWRSFAAVRLANWTVTGDWDQINANLTLVDLLLSPRGGAWPFARRSLFPPGKAVSKMYRLPSSAVWRLVFWRLAHAPKLIARYLIALWRVRGGRHWVNLPESTHETGPRTA
jgi:Uncharacterised nucleotidyltransferase